MKNLKRFLTVVFSLALTLSLWFTGATLAKTAKAEGAKTYDISEVYSMNAGAEQEMTHAVKYEGTVAVNYGDTVEFMFKERSTGNSDGNFSRFAFSIGNYGFYFYHSPAIFGIRTSDLTQSLGSRWGRGGTNFTTIENVNVFKEYRKISVTTTLKDENTVTLTMIYNDGTANNTITHDFTKVANSDMKFRFGDSDVNENFIKSTKAAAEPAEPVTYDITEVYPDLIVGNDLSMAHGTVYTGNEVKLGDTVKFVYKMNAEKNPEHYARSAFAIGAYGIYFYCSSDAISIRPADLSGGTFVRGSELTTINRLPFSNYNELTLKAYKAENSHIMLVMTYHEDGEIKSVSLDYGDKASPDMKFRFGDGNIDGNVVKSTITAHEPKTYDITEVYDITEGEELSPVHGTKYEGAILDYGDAVEFEYKMRETANSDGHFSRTSFGIGSYGMFFYCSGDNVDVYTVNVQNSLGRLTKFTTITRAPFAAYNRMSVKTTLKDSKTVTFTLSYTEGGEVKTITHDFTYDAASDMKFRFGDANIDGTHIKSTIVPPVFGDGSFTYSAYVEGVNVYGGCNLSVIASEKAAAAGVPEGFTGNVLKMSNADMPGQTDMALDFSALNYKRKFITGLSFRIYIVGTASDNAKHPEFRIPYPGKPNNWVVGGGIGANKTDEWITVSLTPDQLDKICIDGYLKTVAVCLRTNAATTMYIDKIELTTIEFEHEPPVISAPVTEFKVTEGAYPVSTDKIATVTDNSGEYFVSYEWSEGALDDLGRLRKGTHTCKVIATDRCDNVATLDITYIVEAEPEITLYKITFKADGADDIVLEYCEDEIEYIELPAAPEKAHYKFEWEAFTFEKNNDQIVHGVYIPEVYTITYVVGYDVYTTVTYTAEDMTIDEPRVPAKKGYEGKWEEYYLDFTNVTVRAIYTRKTDKPTESESSSESESTSESTSGSTSETTPDSGSEAESGTSESIQPDASGTQGSENDSVGCGSGLYGGVTALGALAISAFIIIRRKKEN